MTIRLTNDIWREVLCRYLSVADIGRMSGTDSFFRALLGASSSRVWLTVARQHCGRFPVEAAGAQDWKAAVAAVWPLLELMPRQVALLTLARCSALPPGHPEAVSLFLYVHWSGERLAASQRMFRLGAAELRDVDLPRDRVTFRAAAGTEGLPLLCCGWSGLMSRVDLVMVNRRVPGNRKLLVSFAELHMRGGGGGGGRAAGEGATNVAARGEHGCVLEAFLSTPSRSQYALLGRTAFGDENYFVDLAAARSSGLSHAEAKHFSSSEVDWRLRQSLAGLPPIQAGGARDFYCHCPIQWLATEVLQLKPEEEEEQREEEGAV